MILLCKKYQYGYLPDYKSRNYFNTLERTYIGEIDLADYLIKDGLSEITYSQIAVDENNAMHYETGSVELTLSNTLTGYGSTAGYTRLSETFLHEFFEIENYTDAFLFTLEIREDDRSDNIFVGVIRKDGMKFSNRANEVFQVMALSLDKEFELYFSDSEIPPFTDIPGASISIELEKPGQNYANLSDVLRVMFAGVSLAVDSSHFINDYYVAQRGYIYSPVPTAMRDKNYLAIPAGYESFYLDKIDKFTYFNSLLMSMGWVWGFEAEHLHIKKLRDTTEDVTEINYVDDFISHSVTYEERNAIRNVVIDGVEYYGARNAIIDDTSTAMNLQFFETWYGIQGLKYYYLGGLNHKIYSSGVVNPGTNSNTPFKELRVRGIVGGAVYDRFFDDDSISVEDETDLSGKYRRKFINDIALTNWYAVDSLGFETIDDKNTIYLKPYINSGTNGTHLDITQARTTNNQFYGLGNAYNPAQDPGVNGIYSRGNPASSMLKHAGSQVYEDYEYYCNSAEFRNNMSMLTGRGDRLRIECVLDGIYTGFNSLYQIEDYPYHTIGADLFKAEKTSIDLINNSTKLSLVQL